MKGGKDPRTQRALHSPVLYTCSSSTIPSLPPPNTTMSSLMATARWPWRGRGTGPDQPTTRFQRGCKSTAGELAGDTAEAIVPGKGAVETSRQVGREPPNSTHTHPFSYQGVDKAYGQIQPHLQLSSMTEMEGKHLVEGFCLPL